MAARADSDATIRRDVDRLEERTALLRERFDDLREAVIRGDDTLRAEMVRGFAIMDQRFDDLRGEMSRGSDVVDQRFEDQRGEMGRGFAAVDQRFEDLRGEMGRGFAVVDQQIGELRGRIEAVDRKMTFFFGTLLVTLLAQMAMQLLR